MIRWPYKDPRKQAWLVDKAAEALRHDTAMAQYAGLQYPEKAFTLASVLNVLAAQWHNLGKPVRDQAYQAAEELLGIRAARGRAGFNRRRK